MTKIVPSTFWLFCVLPSIQGGSCPNTYTRLYYIYPSLKVAMLAVDWFTCVHVSCMLLVAISG